MAGGSFTKPGAPVANLEAAARERLADAEALFSAGRYHSAIAMGLYALEILVKEVVCKRLDIQRLPRPFEIHDLESLLIVSGLSGKINRIKRPRGVKDNWDALVELAEGIDKFRYSADPAWDRALAEKTLRQLRDPPNGVLLWLSKQS